MSGDETIIASFNQSSISQNTQKAAVCCLVQYNGDQMGKRFSVEKNMNIAGRSPEASIFIDEPSVSRMHAKIFSSVGKITIEDLGSSNGTFINDEAVKQKSTLKDGDMIRLGAIILKFFSSTNMDNLIHDKIYRLVTIDVGTGVYNKRHLQNTISSEFKVARTYNQDISVIYYDLDFFKSVNDTYGHDAGDQILKESAHLVKTLIRKQDILCRFGGEEFVIILPSTSEKVATDLAERIRQSLENHVFKIPQSQQSGQAIVKHQQTISMGVAGINADIKSAKELLEKADRRLYHSKQTGRNKVTAAGPA